MAHGGAAREPTAHGEDASGHEGTPAEPGGDASTLAAHLRDLTRDAPIPFSRYMELALYDPRWGYYARPDAPRRTGVEGDFLTAPTTHRFFGAALARSIAGWREAHGLDAVHVLEAGGGGGELAEALLASSPRGVASYTLVERSPTHREAAGRRLEGRATRIPVHVRGELPLEMPGPTLLLANELLDNLPVAPLRLRPGPRERVECHELHVSFGPRGAAESFEVPTAEACAFFDGHLSKHAAVRALEEEAVYPAPLAACRFVREASRIPGAAGMLLVDYAATTPDVLGSTSARGTVTTHRLHDRSGNPYDEPGARDITYTVDFDAIAWALAQEGWRVAGRTTQARFLLGLGIAEEAARAAREMRTPQGVNDLVLLKELFAPEGMGERFKVLLAEPEDAPPRGPAAGFGTPPAAAR